MNRTENSEENGEVQEDEDNIGISNDHLLQEITLENGRQLRERSSLTCPQKYSDYVTYATTTFEEPETYKEAMKSTQQDDWKQVMYQKNQTWFLEDLPPGTRAIRCKWVYKNKTNPDGSIDKFKA